MVNLRQLVRRVPPSAAQSIKRFGVYFRYTLQMAACRAGYVRYGKEARVPLILIAGLPKSGTTWVKKMLSSYPGYHPLLIPEATMYELDHGGSHDFELPVDVFQRFQDLLVVTKMHIHGSPHNTGLIHNAGIRYLVIYRDLRDVAVSYVHYVRRTPWHPQYAAYKPLSVEEGLRQFANHLLQPYVDWVRSWETNRDPALSLVLKYEDLLCDPHSSLARAAAHFELDDSDSTVRRIVAEHSFRTLSGGRQRGEENHESFYRKGESGDWVNHFTPELKKLYRKKIGDFLIRHDYEMDRDW